MAESRGPDAVAEIRRELDRAELKRATAVKRLAASLATILAVAAGVATTVGVAPSRSKAAPTPSRDEVVMALETVPEPKIASPKASATSMQVEQQQFAPAPRRKTKTESAERALASTSAQKVSIRIGAYGFDPSVVRVKAGSPVTLDIDRGEGCAAGFLIPELGISADNSTGPATVKLPALRPGTYRFSCGMEMVTGTLVVG